MTAYLSYDGRIQAGHTHGKRRRRIHGMRNMLIDAFRSIGMPSATAFDCKDAKSHGETGSEFLSRVTPWW